MPKNALIIHGTDGVPEDHWQPWLKTQLELSGYNVVVPQFPTPNQPNFATWSSLVKNEVADLTDGILVGHSAGTTIILRLLESDWFPAVKAAILVGTFLNERLVKNLPSYNPEQFTKLLPTNDFDIAKIKSKCRHFYFVHGDNDPYCDYNDALVLAQKLGGRMITIVGGHHLGSERNLTELPEVMTALNEMQYCK